MVNWVQVLFVLGLYGAYKRLEEQDSSLQKNKLFLFGFYRKLQKTANRTHYAPSFTFVTKSVLRWMHPNYSPLDEGDTEQALEYLKNIPILSTQA